MAKITEKASSSPGVVINVYTNLNVFGPDMTKAMITIFEEMIKHESDPNPLAVELAPKGEDLVNELLVRMENETIESTY
jgi:hypothetical protein